MDNTRVCVVGTGVVGGATLRGLAALEFDVTGVDINPAAVASLTSESYSAYTPGEFYGKGVGWDISILCVSTPLVNGRKDLQYLEKAALTLGQRLATMNRYHVIVVRSTVPPGTTENLVARTVAEQSGKRVGIDFGVCVWPEFLREKSALADFMRPPLILIGQYDDKSGESLRPLYDRFNCPVEIRTLAEAELSKMVHNAINATMISVVNEYILFCHDLGLDPERVLSTIPRTAESRLVSEYGFHVLYEALAWGRSCFPVDVPELLGFAAYSGLDLRILRQVMTINDIVKDQNGVCTI